jgi:NADH-quinone oxidoreductase subunit C
MSGISTNPIAPVIEILCANFQDIDFGVFPLMPREDVAKQQMCVRVPGDRLVEVMNFLRFDPSCMFEQLVDLTCVDYLEFPDATDRYGVTYGLLSLTKEHRLWVKCFANDPTPEVPSVTCIWKGADWQEREVWDMFGVKFTGHYDLRRILTWEGFEAHPLRKDYPLEGRGEREDFKRIERDSA